MYSSGNPAVVAIEAKTRLATKHYLKAMTTSVKTAGLGIAFADDAVDLCKSLGQRHGTDVRKFIKEMQQMAHRAHGDAENTHRDFSAVQETLLQVCIRDTTCSTAVDRGDQQIIRLIPSQIEAKQDLILVPPDPSVRSTQMRRKNVHERGKCSAYVIVRSLNNTYISF